MSRRCFLLIVLGLTVVHGLLAAVLPLSGDEVYYWDCSRHPDWSYFDQPPLLPWLMLPSRAVLGETRLAVRAPAIAAGLAIGLVLLPLVRRLGGDTRQAALAYLLLHGMPLFFLGSFYASTDVVMTAAYFIATWAAVSLAQGDQRGWWGFWLATGLGFLAKMPMVLVLPAVLPVILPALRQRQARQRLLRPMSLLAPLAALLLSAPVWIWGWQHGWDNIVFQLHGRHRVTGFTLRYLGELLGTSMLLATPLLAIAMLIAWCIGWRRHGRNPAWQVLLVAVAMPVLLFGLVSLRSRVGGHWCGPALLLGVVPLVLVPFRGRRWLLWPGALLGLALSVTVIAAVLSPASLLDLQWSYAGRPHRISTDRVAAVIANEQIAAAVSEARRPHELVASESYTTVHLLAFLSGGELPTRLAHVKPGKHGLASLYWYTPEELRGKDVLFVTEKHQVDQRLREIFAEVSELPPIEIRRDNQLLRRVRLLRCNNLQYPKGAFSRR